VTVKDFAGGTADYYNLVINDVNTDKTTFQLGAGLIVAGSLTVSSSTFYLNGQSLEVTESVSNDATIRQKAARL